MTTALFRPCTTTPAEARRIESPDLLELARRPFTLRVTGIPVLVRPAGVRDLHGVAAMHRRCTPRSLLDRYRRGGRPPTAAALDAELRNAFGYLAIGPDGGVIATASIRPDPSHHHLSAEANLLVEDGWQRLGVGGELVAHLAGVAHVAGFHELIAYPATALGAAQRLMVEVGRSRMVPGADAHLHTSLSESCSLGLGTVRRRLAG